MNALEAASLVMIPSGYENGTLGSLKPTDGTGDFTFSRGSDISATRVNEDGYIEKGYENLLLNSNLFDNGGIPPSIWSTINANVVSGQSGYDGTNDAWLLSNTPANGYLRANYSFTGLVTTTSIYAKAESYDFLFLFSGTAIVYFDLINGSVGTTAGSQLISTSIESVGGGWYRCSITHNFNGVSQIRFYPAIADGDLTGTSGSIYIQDAMLNQGLVAYPYVETTTAPVAGGILEDMPRLDYTDSSCPALLLEPQRTNLVPYSEYLDGWLSSITYTNTTALNPEGRSVNSFYKRIVSQSIVVNSNQTYSVSAYAKKDTWNWIYVRTANFDAAEYTWFDLENGVVGNAAAGHGTPTITSEGNGWYRCTIYFSSTTDLQGNIYISGVPSNGSTTQGSNDQEAVFIDMIQCEAGSYPTSYIPTYGTSQTRLADVCGGAGNTSTFNDNEGVLYAEISVLANDGTFRNISVSNGTFSQAIRIYYRNNDDEITIFLNSDSGGNTTISIPSATDYIKLVVKYDTDTIKIFINGVLEDTLSSLIMPTGLQQLDFSRAGSLPFYGNTKQLTYFPTALSDDECIALTTIS